MVLFYFSFYCISITSFTFYLSKNRSLTQYLVSTGHNITNLKWNIFLTYDLWQTRTDKNKLSVRVSVWLIINDSIYMQDYVVILVNHFCNDFYITLLTQFRGVVHFFIHFISFFFTVSISTIHHNNKDPPFSNKTDPTI